MTGDELRTNYLEFFAARGHAVIPPAPLIPTNDPTTLFTSSGMQQLVPFLKGEPHPMGTRLTDSQPCFRAEDIDEVGDNRHTTFFEMLGNWSLGDYFKKDQLGWCFDFFTQAVGLDPDRLYVSVFAGDKIAPRDSVSIKRWQQLFETKSPSRSGEKGFHPQTKIYTYDATKNWWSRAGTPDKMPVGEIGGTTSEIFFDFGPSHKFHEHSKFKNLPCHINCDCGRFLEIGNSVFMEYVKQKDGSFKPLPAKNVDFGGGFERILAASQDQPDIFKTTLFTPIIEVLETNTTLDYDQHAPAIRRIADHFRGAVAMGSEGIVPSNKEQGYFMRRLIRRAMISMRQTNIDYTNPGLIAAVVSTVGDIYSSPYPRIKNHLTTTTKVIIQESQKFAKTLDRGIKQLESLPTVTGKDAFDLYQSYGLPLEITQELMFNLGKTVDQKKFIQEFRKHQQISRAGATKKFKGGLADHSEVVTKLHTATHLLHAALHNHLGSHIRQEGSNITAERLRFDFAHPDKITPEQIKKIEAEINQKIKEDLPVTKTVEDRDTALKSGAMAFFKEKYPAKVSVYTIGPDAKHFYSREFCGGPHVSSTGQIGAVRITKEESIGSGKRRIYATLA